MAQLMIRQLDDVAAARLRERAAAVGYSMEREVREILTTACTEQQAVVARLRSRLASCGDHRFSDSSELVRVMRDERGGLG